MQKLFTYAILFLPKPTKDASGNDTTLPGKIIVAPTHVLAGSEQEVALKAAKQIPDEYDDKLEQVTVLVRGF